MAQGRRGRQQARGMSDEAVEREVTYKRQEEEEERADLQM